MRRGRDEPAADGGGIDLLLVTCCCWGGGRPAAWGGGGGADLLLVWGGGAELLLLCVWGGGDRPAAVWWGGGDRAAAVVLGGGGTDLLLFGGGGDRPAAVVCGGGGGQTCYMVNPTTRANLPTLPRSNRQYVPPLMLAKGRGKRLDELHSSKNVIGAKSCVEGTTKFRKSIGDYASQSQTVPKKVCRSVIEDDDRASFDPLFTPPPRGAIIEDWDSSSDSYGDNNGIQSPLEDEHMNLDQGTENADDNLNDVNEDNENPNVLDLEDINENILENVDGNDLEEAQTNQEVPNAAFNRKPPNGLDEKEWKWLIKEVYSSEDFKKVSARNSANRVHYPKELAHRMGSKPFRQVIWKDLGGNKGMKPKLVDIFHSTRKKGTSLPNVETAKKLIAQKVFNSKSRDRVVGFGGGMKVADLRGQRPSREELEAELNSTKKQNQILEDRMEAIQDENNQLKGRI
ncbi:Transcription elongation factor SPT5, partial [Bienertia sinuspersici]